MEGFKNVIPIRVAYFLLRFPCITETFIAEEIQGIQTAGIEVCIYSLLKPKDELIQPVSRKLMPLVRYTPGFFDPRLLLAQLGCLLKSPKMYIGLLWTLLQQPAPSISFYFKRILVFAKSIWLASIISRQPVQLIHSHFAWLPAVSGWIVSRLTNIPCTVTTHAFDIYSSKNDLLRLTASQADRIITISENNKHSMLARIENLNPAKIQIVRCGIDLHYFQNSNEKSFATGKSLQITSVGSLIEKKGHEYLIQACARLAAQGMDFKCVIIGEGWLHERLASLIRELHLQNCVSLTGSQSQEFVRERLQQSDVFVLACTQANDGEMDGIPVAMMEALAMRVPVVTTAVSGIPELVKNEETGLIALERDPESISLAMTRIAKEKDLCERLTSNGYALVKKDYDISSNIQKLKNIFLEVIEGRA